MDHTDNGDAKPSTTKRTPEAMAERKRSGEIPPTRTSERRRGQRVGAARRARASPAVSASGLSTASRERSIEASLSGHDVMVVKCRRGSGKSVCHQYPLDDPCRSRWCWFPAAAGLDSRSTREAAGAPPHPGGDASTAPSAARRARQRVTLLAEGGSLQAVMTTPETLGTAEMGGEAPRRASGIALAAVDEAHRISRMGPRLPPRLHGASRQ